MALFSKKHYHALRDALRKSAHRSGGVSSSPAWRLAVEDCIGHIAVMLSEDNPAFERQRFITEIYVPEHRSQE